MLVGGYIRRGTRLLHHIALDLVLQLLLLRIWHLLFKRAHHLLEDILDIRRPLLLLRRRYSRIPHRASPVPRVNFGGAWSHFRCHFLLRARSGRRGLWLAGGETGRRGLCLAVGGRRGGCRCRVPRPHGTGTGSWTGRCTRPPLLWGWLRIRGSTCLAPRMTRADGRLRSLSRCVPSVPLPPVPLFPRHDPLFPPCSSARGGLSVPRPDERRSRSRSVPTAGTKAEMVGVLLGPARAPRCSQPGLPRGRRGQARLGPGAPT